MLICDQIKTNQIKLIISDENMEYCNGSDSFLILNKMFSSDKLKRIPLWIVTCLEDVEQLKSIKETCGCDLVLSKPVSKAVLVENLKNVFK